MNETFCNKQSNILHPDKVGHLLPSAVIILGVLAMYSIITKHFTSKKHSNASDLVSIMKLTNKTSIKTSSIKTLKYKKLKNLKRYFSSHKISIGLIISQVVVV